MAIDNGVPSKERAAFGLNNPVETVDDVDDTDSIAPRESARDFVSSNLERDAEDSNQVYGYDRNLYTVEPGTFKPVNAKRTDTMFEGQRVQVSQEETGSQRVQVNNGFEEEYIPGLNPESGRISSGVLLEWKLVFYGTGPEAGSGDGSDDTSEADFEL